MCMVLKAWWFNNLKNKNGKMNNNGKLTTYSYARPVREALKQAGFEVISGPKIGRRSPSTIAIK